MNLKQFIKYKIYEPVMYLLLKPSNLNDYQEIKNKKKIIIMQIPKHGNLGDQAIAYAQREFVEKNFSDYKCLEISYDDVVKEAKAIKKILKDDDLIFIHGGGNMGDMYSVEEEKRRFIIKYFKNVTIISCPQTISFSDTLKGRKELEKSKTIYRSNPNLKIIAREKKSYDLMKKVFGEEKVILTPDIVLSLDKRKTSKRAGIVTCLRNDIEGILDNSTKKNFIEKLKGIYNEVTVTDTVVNRDVPLSHRSEELERIWSVFRGSEVVITDRLHGMIFCAITGTPCIVFKNFNHKIEYSYKNWLSDLEYIKFVDINNIDTAIELIEELRQLDLSKLKFNNCREKFMPLIQFIKNSKFGEKYE